MIVKIMQPTEVLECSAFLAVGERYSISIKRVNDEEKDKNIWVVFTPLDSRRITRQSVYLYVFKDFLRKGVIKIIE